MQHVLGSKRGQDVIGNFVRTLSLLCYSSWLKKVLFDVICRCFFVVYAATSSNIGHGFLHGYSMVWLCVLCLVIVLYMC